ncbi:HD domain-containing protein [Lentzea albida]|uniref:Histidine kinase-, DNA gyrase B-, and HSP90-like ATPase n=1 Tax=Lentzea albida TaxID=65499 RepID=A0A1H9F5H9_9PSEU|nr:hypothetical protein [Lentzea albida]SEQ33244.1 hypothetical protein SAMN04488000_102545 [Lentzea albida]
MTENDPRLVIEVTAPLRPLTEVSAAHPWTKTACTHLGPSNTMLHACAALVSHLAREHDSHTVLAADPWRDASFAERFTQRLRWLTSQVLPVDALLLSDAEASLLVVFPYLHQAFWAQRAATVLQGADPATAAFEPGGDLPGFTAFAEEHGALHRRGTRAAEAGTAAAASIGWWLFHRWLVRQPECYDPSTITPLLPESLVAPLDAVLTASRLMELMRVVQLDPAYLRRVDRPGTLKPTVRIAGGTEDEQGLREQLLGYLLVVAHRTAIDPTALPRVVADHLGIDDGVQPDAVLTSIRAVTWDGDRTRVLTTDCRHPATVLALHDRAAAVDAVLTEIVLATEESETLAPLKHLPVHASADGTTPTTSASSHRFRLADDQIQTLLMGEQLYGSAELAVRELYQNALDACRYREARTSYLIRTNAAPPAWQGRIDFRQGVDEKGRPFLECADNGIGMGERELVDVFAQAGVRFTDLPEYVEEQADWAVQGVESFPNSRFGIGVLSYFMLADEITVTTCRLGRSGLPGRRLEVHIAGPDALFRVRDVGAGEDAGTVVRLHLRSAVTPVSCTDLLRRLLWLSDFAVTSHDSGGSQEWEPRQLSAAAPIGSNDPFMKNASRSVQKIVSTDDTRVWWCDCPGAVLADGLWAGTLTFGAVVDLVGHNRPRLTVDRTKMIDFDPILLEERLKPFVPDLVSATDSPLSHWWLGELAKKMPRLADDICDYAVGARYRPWRIGNTEAPIEVVGCFPSDAAMVDPKATAPRWNQQVSKWRSEAWLQVEEPSSTLSGSIIPARPSDESLLDSQGVEASLGSVLQASIATRRTPAEVLARLALLGVNTAALVSIPATPRPTDPNLLRDHVDKGSSWLSQHRPVSPLQVLRAATASGLSPADVVERLAELGYDTSRVTRIPAHDDAALLPDHHGGLLHKGGAVPAAHIMVAAAKSRRPPAEVARRLAELGYTTPDPATLPPDFNVLDPMIFLKHPQRTGTYVEDPVPRRHVFLSAWMMSDASPAGIATRLRAAGLDVSALNDLPQDLTSFDRTIMREQQDIDGVKSGPLHRQAVTVGHVISAALKTHQRPVVVARRLAGFGYECPAAERLPDDVNSDDLNIIGMTRSIVRGDSSRSWLPTGMAVSLQHVVITAAKHAKSPSFVAERLARFGFDTPTPHPRLTVRFEDLILLSVDLDGEGPWLDSDHHALAQSDNTVPLGHVLAAAAKLGTPPAEVAERLSELGLNSQKAALPSRVERRDAQLLAQVVPREISLLYRHWMFAWLGLERPVSTRHLMLQSRSTTLTPAEVASRLSALGFAVTDPQHLPSSIDEIDEKLLHVSTPTPHWFEFESDFAEMRFPRRSVMHMAHETGLSLRGVLDRLARLGVEVTD